MITRVMNVKIVTETYSDYLSGSAAEIYRQVCAIAEARKEKVSIIPMTFIGIFNAIAVWRKC